MLINLIRNLPEDPIEAVEFLMDCYSHSQFDKDEDILDYYNLLKVVVEKSGWDISLEVFNYQNLAHELPVIHGKIKGFVIKMKQKLSEEKVIKALSMHKLGSLIQDEAIKTIQESINKLRDEITLTNIYSEEHKKRLLEKLESLQNEIHKTIPNKDILFSGAIKFGVLLRDIGEKSQPLTENAVKILDSAGKLIEKIWGINTELPSLSSEQKKLLSLSSK